MKIFTHTKISVAIIVLLVISNIYFYFKSTTADALGVDAYDQEQKCLAWTIYNPKINAWRWRAESLEEYFPSREDAVSNCIVMLNQVKAGN